MITLIRRRLEEVASPRSILSVEVEGGGHELILTREELVELLDEAEETLASRWRQFGFNHIPAPVPGATSVDEYGWSTRVCNAFKAAGIVDMEQLRSMSDKDLLRIPNFGKTCLREVRQVLSEYVMDWNAVFERFALGRGSTP